MSILITVHIIRNEGGMAGASIIKEIEPVERDPYFEKDNKKKMPLLKRWKGNQFRRGFRQEYIPNLNRVCGETPTFCTA